MPDAAAPSAPKKERLKFWIETLPKLLNYLMLVLALGLIGFISWDTWKGIDFLRNPAYMKYQLATCVIFLIEFFYRFIISKNKLIFLILASPFFFISIPYLNIIAHYGLHLSPEILHYLRLLPILRGLFALVMVVNYVTKNLSTTVFASYMLVLLPIVYMAGFIFYVAEHHVNAAVKNLWYALWWAGMNVSTIGCYINPVTNTGMVLGLVLSLLGIIMFPLFTVYLGDVIRKYSHRDDEGNKHA